MILQSSRALPVRQNNFSSTINPEENSLSFSRFQSPRLKLGRVRSWKFIYQSPTRVQQKQSNGPLQFSKQAHKLIVRKLPKFHSQIMENDPLKNSKIIENINFFREQERKKLNLSNSKVDDAEITRDNEGQYEVRRMMVDSRFSKGPSELRMSRSLSCTFKPLDSSRCSVIQGLKSGDSLLSSRLKQNVLLSSRLTQIKPKEGILNMASSRYLASIQQR